MKCNNCGFEYEDSLNTCPNCNGVLPMETISLNPAADMVSAAIKSGLFLTMCILMTLSCVLGFADGIPILNILFTIFMWLAYAQARDGILDGTHLRSLSGTTFAVYVINFVLAGCMLLLGICIPMVSSIISETPELFDELTTVLESEFAGISDITVELFNSYSVIFTAIFIVIAIAILVFNIIGFKKIHNLIKSVYQSIDMNLLGFRNVKAAKVWLYIIGIFDVISAVLYSQGSGLLASLCPAVTAILAAVIIGKYLENKN